LMAHIYRAGWDYGRIKTYPKEKDPSAYPSHLCAQTQERSLAREKGKLIFIADLIDLHHGGTKEAGVGLPVGQRTK